MSCSRKIRQYLFSCSTVLLVFGQSVQAAEDRLGGFDCLIEPYLVADLSTREEGIVDEFLVRRGDLIKKGQELVKLDAQVEKAAVNLARGKTRLKAEISEKRARMKFTQQQFERIDELYKNKGTTLSERDEAANKALLAKLILNQAKHREELAKLELARAEELLKRRTILSPIDGVVLRRLLALGESVNDKPIVRVAQINIMNVEVIIPIEYYGRVLNGMRASVVPRFPGGEPRVATVTVVDRVIDAASDTFGVRLELPNPDLKIPGGIRCDIEFDETGEGVLPGAD